MEAYSEREMGGPGHPDGRGDPGRWGRCLGMPVTLLLMLTFAFLPVVLSAQENVPESAKSTAPIAARQDSLTPTAALPEPGPQVFRNGRSKEEGEALKGETVRRCIAAYTPEKILAEYGRLWNDDWLDDSRAAETYRRLLSVYEFRAHLAQDAAPCDRLKRIRYCSGDKTCLMRSRCRSRYFLHRHVVSVLGKQKHDPGDCLAAMRSSEDNPYKKKSYSRICQAFEEAFRSGDASSACARMGQEENLLPGRSAQEARQVCLSSWLVFARGEYADCDKNAYSKHAIQRDECQDDVQLVRALRSPVPEACGESPVCTFYSRPSEEAVRQKETALVDEFCGQLARREGTAVMPPTTAGQIKQEAK